MYLHESIEHYGIKDIEEWKIYQTARNPMDRMVSAFLHQKRILRGLNKQMDNTSFEDFVKAVNKHHHLLPEKERTFANSVLSKDGILAKNDNCSKGVRFYVPQTTWADPQKYNVQYIKLGEDNSGVYEDMGLPSDLKLPFLNKSKFNKSRYKYLHTEQTTKIIESLYKDDFDKIKYES